MPELIFSTFKRIQNQSSRNIDSYRTCKDCGVRVNRNISRGGAGFRVVGNYNQLQDPFSYCIRLLLKTQQYLVFC